MQRSAVAALLFLGLFALSVRGDVVLTQLVDKRGVPIRAASLEAGRKVAFKKPTLSLPSNSTYKPVFHSEPVEPLNLNNAVYDAATSTKNSVRTNGLLAVGALTGLKEAVKARVNDPVLFEAGHKVVDKKPTLSIPPLAPSNTTHTSLFKSEPAEPLNVNNAVGDAASSTKNSVRTNGLLALGALTGLKEALRARINDPKIFEAGHKVVDKKPTLSIPALAPSNSTHKSLFKSEPAEPLNVNNAVGDAATSTKNSVRTNGLLALGALTGLKEALRARINDPKIFEAGRKVTESTRLNAPATILKNENGQYVLSTAAAPQANSGFGGALLPRADGKLSMFSGKQAKAAAPAPAPAPAAKGADAPEESLNDQIRNLGYDAAMSTYNSGLANGLLLKSAADGLKAFGVARANDGIGKGLRLFGGRRAAPAPEAAEASAATAMAGTTNESGPAHGTADKPSFKLPHLGAAKPRVQCPTGYEMGSLGKCVRETQRTSEHCFLAPTCSNIVGYNETEKIVLDSKVQQLVADAMALKKAGLGLPKPLQALVSSAANGTVSVADLTAARDALGQHVSSAAKAKGKGDAFAGVESRDMVDAGAKLLSVPWASVPDVAKLSASVSKATKAVPSHLLGDVKAVAPKSLSRCCKTSVVTDTTYAAPTLVCDKGTLDILKFRCA